MYVTNLRDSELKIVPPHPDLWQPSDLSTDASPAPPIFCTPDEVHEAPERPHRAFPHAPTLYLHAEICAIAHTLVNNTAPPTGTPDIPVHTQSLSYKPLSPAASIAVPATLHNTPDELPNHPEFSTLTLPNPDHHIAYDTQVHTLPIEYARAFTAEYNVPDFATRPIISNNNEAIPVFTIAAPTPVARLNPLNFGLTLGHAKGDTQNMGADERPLSPFTDWADYSTRAMTSASTRSHSAEPDTEDEDAENHMKEIEMRKHISDFLSEVFQPITEDIVEFVQDEINERQANTIRKWSFRTSTYVSKLLFQHVHLSLQKCIQFRVLRRI